MAVTQVQGLDEVLKNLNKQIKSIEGDVQKGLSLEMHEIKSNSIDNTPVDVGNLRASHYMVSGKGGNSEKQSGEFKTKKPSGARVAREHPTHVAEASAKAKSKAGPFVEIGCTAFYAEYVHEDLEASHMKRAYTPKGFMGPAPVKQIGKAKFMEDAIKAGVPKLLSTIRRFAKR